MSSGQTEASESSLTRRGLLAVAAMSTVAAGCGQSTYAERVNRTVDVFNYRAKLDQNLQAEWAHPSWGMAMRPPNKFRLKPAPPPPKKNEEGVSEVVVDTRQPSYLGIELPGLVACWEVPNEANLFLCSNHQRFLDSQGGSGDLAPPENFLSDLEAVLQQGFEFTLSAEAARGPSDVHAKFPERIPSSDKFAQPEAYDSILIRKESEPQFSATVYERKADKIQVAVILVYSPKFTTGVSDLESGLRLALETLRVDAVVPRAATAPGGGPGGGVRPPAF